MTIIGEDKEAFDRAQAVRDPIEECQRRWSDFAFTEPRLVKNIAGVPIRGHIQATWKIEGREHGLGHNLPIKWTDEDVRIAKANIARAAIYNDECRRARG